MNSALLNRIKDRAFQAFGLFCTLFGLIMLTIFLGNLIIKGINRIDIAFLCNLPSRFPERAGIYSALLGTCWILSLTALIAIPIGVSAGLYLEEYSRKNRFASLLEVNLTNLAGIPSIIYGLLGLELFVHSLQLGHSIIAGSLTLALLILPLIIVATRDSVRAVPKSLREGSLAMGATKWQTIWLQVLPAASGGILSGAILSLSRVVGEAAPLIVVGSLAYISFAPTNPTDEFSVLPIQIFNWVSKPQQGFITNSAAAIIILLLVTFMMNGIAIYLRNRWLRRIKRQNS
jgi:phosphate transport system permease protein